MEEITRGTFLALYSQIALVDAESPDAYPEWVTGDEIAIMNSKGVAVSALGDTLVDVVVYEGEEGTEGTEYLSGIIQVGNKGLLVGNEAAGNFSTFAWPPGRTMVRVYANGPKDNATRVTFVLQHLYEG